MNQYVGLDVSLEETALCVMGETGAVVREAKVATTVEAIAAAVAKPAPQAVLIGLETGPLSTWLWHGLRAHGLPVVCICARAAKPFLKLWLNKTDRNDARAIAQLMRLRAFKEVHVKSLDTHAERALLSARALLVKMRCDLENQLRGLLKTFGGKLGPASGGRFEVRVRELAAAQEGLSAVVEPLLAARAALRTQIATLDRKLRAAARRDPVCRRLMSVDGVGALTALAYKYTIEDPHRFRRASSVGAYLGLTPRRYNSGEVDYTGRISKHGDAMMRSLLFEAANALLSRCAKPSALRAWALRLARRIGAKRAKVALARKLAVILHRIWIDGTTFRRAAQAA